MHPIVLATTNPGKIRELRAIFLRLGVPVVALDELPAAASTDAPAETGDTFEANARAKALWYARHTGRLCLGEDSGLCIDALDGAPGVVSARYAVADLPADTPRTDRDRLNNERVLGELGGVPPHLRTARFVCVMALAGPDVSTPGAPKPAHDAVAVLAVAQGIWKGRIGMPGPADRGGVPRGEHGFGYDPIFLVPPEYARTSAELLPDEKNMHSHRARAARRMAQWLRSSPLAAAISRP